MDKDYRPRASDLLYPSTRAEVERHLAITTPITKSTTYLATPLPSAGSVFARDVGYDIRDTWIDPADSVPEIAPVTIREVSARVVELAELHEHDTHDLYALLEDA
ncbi:hypothetical protein Tco_0483532, partial [Tanacetum coccineum]